MAITQYELMVYLMNELEVRHNFSRTTTPEKQDAVNKLVQYGIVSHTSYAHGSTYTRGPHFNEARIKGPQKYIEGVNKKYNPSKLRSSWEYLSNNPLVSGLIGGLVGGVLVQMIALYITR